ncbi:LCP family protein [Streptomyces sp. NPDC051320]|uniref:LCP family protein n=1 Tax=Streptomyces sp. NPDC051320 TaxID=3154644 RepID=UPI003448886F
MTKETEDGAAAPAPVPVRRRSRKRKVLLGVAALLAVGVIAAGGVGWWAVDHYTDRVERIPNAFPTHLPAAAQPSASAGGETFLLVGVDSRSDLPTTGKNAKAPEWTYGAQRSDTMMLVHLPKDHSSAYVVSLPRDSWVDIPGHGTAKLNAAFSWGGPPLLIDTVQRLTDVKVDHLAVIDWDGFKRLTDAVGGVDLTVDGTRRHMNGTQALVYVRERHSLPRGDLDRTHRQQYFLRAVLSKVMDPGTLSNPLKAGQVLSRLTESVSVDDRLGNGDLRDLLWSSRGIRPAGMVFMNAPVTGTGMIKGQSVVLLDRTKDRILWDAMRKDSLKAYVAGHRTDRLGASTP